MKNSTESYQNIYKLDDIDSDVWFSGDASSEDIDTTLSTPKILINYNVKRFRKNWLDLKGDEEESLYVDIYVGGAEKLAGDSVSANNSKKITLEDENVFKPYYISLPPKMKGRWARINISGEGVDWSLNEFIFHYLPSSIRNISVFEAADNVVEVRLASTTGLTNAQCCTFYRNNLFVGTYGPGTVYIKKYEVGLGGSLTLKASATIASGIHVSSLKATANYLYATYGGHEFAIYDHSLTLQDSASLDTTSNNAMRIAISDDENHAWISHVGAKDVYYFDISDKAAISACADALTGAEYFELIYHNNYLIASDYSGNWIRVYDVSSPATVPYSTVKQVTTQDITRMVLGSDVNKVFYAGATSTNGPGIIDISTITAPTVSINDDAGNFFGREIARKENYLFVLDADSDIVRVVDMSTSYNALASESSLSTTIGDYNGTPNQIGSEADLAYNGENLLAYCSIASNLIYVFKIYGV
jgi:hypothetical protein